MKDHLAATLSAIIIYLFTMTACIQPNAQDPSETSLSDTFSEGEETKATDTVYKDDGFDIYVPDYTGNMRTIFADKTGDEYFVGMESVFYDPDRYMGYGSTTYTAAYKEKKFDISDPDHIDHKNINLWYIDPEDLDDYIAWNISEDDLTAISELFQEFDPVFVSDEEHAAIDETDTEYDRMHPLVSIVLADNVSVYEMSSAMETHELTISFWASYSEIEMKNMNGKTYGRILINDLTPVKKLITEGEITPDNLRNAYSQTSISASGWFEIGDSALYNYSLNTLRRTVDIDSDRDNQRSQSATALR